MKTMEATWGQLTFDAYRNLFEGELAGEDGTRIDGLSITLECLQDSAVWVPDVIPGDAAILFTKRLCQRAHDIAVSDVISRKWQRDEAPPMLFA